MSALVFLLNYSTGIPTSIGDVNVEEEGYALAEAKYQVPILWMALFTEANITTAMVAYDRDANGELLRSPEPTVFASKQEALATYARRKDALRNIIGPAYAQHVDEWERLLASPFVKGTHFQIDFSDLSGMYQPGEFEPTLRAWVNGVETLAGPGWADLCGQANLGDPKSDVVHYGIRGWTAHDEELGWME